MKKFLPLIIVIAVLIGGYFYLGKPSFKLNAVPSDRFVTTSNGVTFKHPESFSGNVRRAIERPPQVTQVGKDKDAQAIGCPKLIGSEVTASGIGAQNGLKYTFAIGEDVGAGQRYSTFCYIFSGADANYVLDFEIHSTNGCGNGQCGPYCGTPNEQECKDFDMEQQVVKTIDTIVSTVVLPK